MKQSNWQIMLAIIASMCIVACSSLTSKPEYPTRRAGDQEPVYNNKRPSIFGGDKSGIGLFGAKKDSGSGDVGPGIAVNAYLWRAALDTLSFMPIAAADPFGGTILTDWYNPPPADGEGLGERVKVNVFILDRTLRADAVKVSIFRQTVVDGAWRDAAVDPATVTEMEDTILTRARQLRVDADTP